MLKYTSTYALHVCYCEIYLMMAETAEKYSRRHVNTYSSKSCVSSENKFRQ